MPRGGPKKRGKDRLTPNQQRRVYDIPIQWHIHKRVSRGGEFYTIREVAALLGVAYNTAYSWIIAGLLPAERIGRYWAVKPPVLRDFCDQYAGFLEPSNISDPSLRAIVMRDEWLTGPEVVRFLHYSQPRVGQLARSGRLPGVRMGDWRFRRRDVEAFLQQK